MLKRVMSVYQTNWSKAKETIATVSRPQDWNELNLFHQYVHEAMDVLDGVHRVASSGTWNTGVSPEDKETLITIVSDIHTVAEHLVIAFSVGDDTEDAIFGVARPSSWVTTTEMCVVLWLFACIAKSTTTPENTRMPRLSELTAFSFPSISDQGLAYSTHSIADYTARDVMWIMSAISRHWYDVTFTDEFERYISAIALRAAMLLRSGHSSGEYSDGMCPAPAQFDPDCLHTIPASDPQLHPDFHAAPSSATTTRLLTSTADTNVAQDVCGPGRLFVATVCSRLSSFMRVISYRHQHTVASFAECIGMAEVTARSPSHTSIAHVVERQMKAVRSTTGTADPTRNTRTTGIWSVADPLDPLLLPQHAEQPHTQADPRQGDLSGAPVRIDHTAALARFDLFAGGKAMAHVLAQYAKNATAEPQIRTAFVQCYLSGLLGPGDAKVYVASVDTAGHRATAHGAIEFAYGNRALCMLRDDSHHSGAASMLADADMWYSTRDSARSSSGAAAAAAPVQPPPGRTLDSIEIGAELAGLAAFDVMFRNHTGVDFRGHFVVPAHDLRASDVQTMSARAFMESQTLAKSKRDLYTTIPLITIGCNTFDLIYHGYRIQTSNVYETLALWLVIIAVAYFGKVPAVDPHQCDSKETIDSLRDINDLCDIALNGPTKYLNAFIVRVGVGAPKTNTTVLHDTLVITQ